MCDQDHSEKEILELEAQGKITRRQFGVMLGAGMAMILPQVPNAVKVTESEVTVKTPEGAGWAPEAERGIRVRRARAAPPSGFGLRLRTGRAPPP